MVPTRNELNTEVDRRFHELHPEGPARLDPHDPGQAELVKSWLEIRDAVVNEWTDKVFSEHFPAAGKLDPKAPADKQLIDYWLDIRNQIRDDAKPRFDWSHPGDPGQPAADATAATAVLSVTAESGGYLLTFDGAIDREAVGRWLWPGGVPAGVELESRSTTTFFLSGLSWDAYQAMDPGVAGMIAEAGVITAEPYDPTATHAGEPTATPPVGVIDEKLKKEIESHIEEWLDGTHRIASTAEVVEYLTWAGAHIAGDAPAAVSVAEVVELVAADILAPLGGLALVIWSGFQVIEAFKSERRGEELQGFVYGVMWEAMDEPDHLPQFAPGMTYSAEEHKEAFESGLKRGREKARDSKVRNRIIITVAVMGEKSGFGEMWAAQQVLSEIWRENREHTPGDRPDDLLMWPQPPDRTVLGF
jgi:hypothetical protein